MTDAESPALHERVHSQSPKQKCDISVLDNTGHRFQISFWILLKAVSVLKKHQSVMNKWTHHHNKQFLMDEASIVMLLWNITQSDNTEIWSALRVSQFWIDMNKSSVFDWFFCCWFSQVIVSVPGAADRSLTDMRCRHARHCWQSKARSLWKAHGERVSVGMETQGYFIRCQNAKGRTHERHRGRELEKDRERERGQSPSKPL